MNTINPGDLPLISIITVCRNAGRGLEKTIASVLSQTYASLEYIIIDGGSTDNTVEIIRRYDSRLAYWHSKPDRGIAQAFNLGLERARGAWILYLNADDVFADATVIGQMEPHLRQHPEADVVYGRVEIITSEAGSQDFPYNRVLGREWSWRIFRLYNLIPHQAAFTNRRYFAKVGQFDEDCSVSVDYEHYLRGGRNLAAIFVPLNMSKMTLGGLSNRNLIRSFQEYQKAQLKNHALTPWEAWLNLQYRLGTYYGRLLFQKINRLLHF